MGLGRGGEAARPLRVLVLGGGLTGLLAARRLQQRGEFVELWEASESHGGWAQTLPWPGMQGEPGWIERGPQNLLWKPGSAVDALLRELELPFQTVPSRKPRWVAKRNRLRRLPQSALGWAFTGLLSVPAKLRILLEPFQPQGLADESLETFVARRLGPGFAEELLPALSLSILAAPPEHISVDAIPSLRHLEAHGSLFLGIRREGLDTRIIPEGGVGALAIRLAAQLQRSRTGLRADRLRPVSGDRWRVSAADRILEVDRVVMALPAFEAARLLAPVAPQVAEAFMELRYEGVETWHSRHKPIARYRQGFSLRLDPADAHGLLGSMGLRQDDPRTVPGWMQARTCMKEAQDGSWEETLSRLQRWLPKLPPAVQHRCEKAPQAIPVPAPGQMGMLRSAAMALPPGLDWIAVPRFGTGLRDAIEGLETWR